MRRILPILLAGFGALLVAGSIGWGTIGNAVADPAVIALPEQLAGLERMRIITGRQAAAELKNLHSEQFPLTSGAVGIYGNNQITVWAAGAPLDFIAAQLVNAMRDKISEGRSPFTEVNAFRDSGRTVYALEGMGQKHYYFQSKNLVIWLAAEPSLADEALRQILEAYP